MHLESVLTGEGGCKDGGLSDTEMIEAAERLRQRAGNTRREPDYAQMTADTEELEEIFRRTFGEPKRFRNT